MPAQDHEAHVRVFNRNGELTNKVISAKTGEGLEKKIQKLEESGNLYEVVGYRSPEVNKNSMTKNREIAIHILDNPNSYAAIQYDMGMYKNIDAYDQISAEIDDILAKHEKGPEHRHPHHLYPDDPRRVPLSERRRQISQLEESAQADAMRDFESEYGGVERPQRAAPKPKAEPKTDPTLTPEERRAAANQIRQQRMTEYWAERGTKPKGSTVPEGSTANEVRQQKMREYWENRRKAQKNTEVDKARGKQGQRSGRYQPGERGFGRFRREQDDDRQASAQMRRAEMRRRRDEDPEDDMEKALAPYYNEPLRKDASEVIEFAEAYSSLGAAVQEQIRDYLNHGIESPNGDMTITYGAFNLIQERLIRNFEYSDNEDIQELVGMLAELKSEYA